MVKKYVDGEPIFSIGLAALFFSKTPSWIRWCEDMGYFTYPNGETIYPGRRNEERKRIDVFQREQPGNRQYTYRDIIDMADSLLRKDKITQPEHLRVLTKVAIMQS